MLDLTYIYPNEPLDTDSKIVLTHLPNWLFNRELGLTLKELGVIWHGAANWTSPLAGDAIRCKAYGSVGAIRTPQVDMGEFLKSLNLKISRFSYQAAHYRCRAISYTASQSSRNIWINFNFISEYET